MSAIRVDQAIHGYDAGHRLLTASISFDAASEREMLFLSDLSGPHVVPGFNDYITAYPLTPQQVYVVARTWYADEMPRPGCVWTHSLIVSFAQLSFLPDIEILYELFSRPTGSLENYKSPLSLNLDERNRHAPSLSMKEGSDWAKLFSALYNHPTKSIVVSGSSSNSYRKTFAGIWNHQWPRLRRSFSFSTGSLTLRKSNGRPLDLQLIPNQMIDMLDRGAIVLLDLDDDSSDSIEVPDWCHSHAERFSKDTDVLDSFLWKFGADLPGERATYSKLAEVEFALERFRNRDAQLSLVIRALCEHFPDYSEAKHLKSQLLGTEQEDYFSKESDLDLLMALVEHDAASHMHLSQAVTYRRMARLIGTSPSATGTLLEIACSQPETRTANHILETALEIITDDQIIDFIEDHPKVGQHMIDRKPSIAENSRLWKLEKKIQESAMAALARSAESESSILYEVIPHIVRYGDISLSERVFSIWGRNAVWAILEWLNKRSISFYETVAREWKEGTSENLSAVLEWYRSKDRLSATAALFLIREKSCASRLSVQKHRDILDKIIDKVDFGEHLDARAEIFAFVFTLSLSNKDAIGAELLSKTFQTVHDAVADQMLPEASWQLMAPNLPKTSLWEAWDRCEQIRRALVGTFVKRNWPETLFIEAFRKKSTFERVISRTVSRGGKRKHKKYLRRVRELMRDGHIKPRHHWQRDLLNEIA